MTTFVKQKLTGSTDGKQIKISAITNGAANTIHTASALGSYDEVWLYVYNDNTAAVNLVILWGGVTEPDNKILIPIPAQAGRELVIDGMLLTNSLIIKAYASMANVLLIDGFVNNIA